MKILAVVGVVAALTGCGGGVTKEELDVTKREAMAYTSQVEMKLRTDLTGTEQKYVRVQQLEGDVNKKLDELTKLQNAINELSKALQVRVDLANTNVLKVLEFEERLLSERLASIRGMIDELKKK